MRWSGPSTRLSPTARPPFTAAFVGSDAAGTDTAVASAPTADAVDVLDPLVGFFQRGLDPETAGHDAATHVGEDVLRLHLDGGRRDGARVARPHTAENVLLHAFVVRIALPVRVLGALLVDGSRLAAAGLHVLLEPLLVLDPAHEVVAELGVLARLEETPVVGTGEEERARRTARREDHLRLLVERV